MLKRGIVGTFHHISANHTGRYVNEFAFRLNDGNVRRHTTQRVNALVDGVRNRRLTLQKAGGEMKLPWHVEKVVDKVLAYHPKPKSKAAKKRVRKAKKLK